MPSILLIDDLPSRAAELRAGLQRQGHRLLALTALPSNLAAQVERSGVEVVILVAELVGDAALSAVTALHRQAPRPLVVLAPTSDETAIRAVVKAGATAYALLPLEPARLAHVIALAVARFEEQQRLQRELATATRKLAERKQIERAKGLLMKTRRLDEEAAYALLRRLAMERAAPLSVVAEEILRMARVLL